jgi:hypothetical protein
MRILKKLPKAFTTYTVGVLLFIGAGVLVGCGVNRQVKEAKALGECKFDVNSIDSVYIAGVDVREFRNMRDFDLAKYPQLGLAFFRKNVPLQLRVNMDITNPTNRTAAVNQVDYKVLLTNNEIFSGILNRRIEVLPGTAPTRVPIQLATNAYDLLSNESTRNEFLNMMQALAGRGEAKPSKFTIKVKPTLALGDKKVNYPGYITIEREISPQMILGN